MIVTRKFYSRYKEATKHMRHTTVYTSHSRTLPASEAVTIRLESSDGTGELQVIKMSVSEAGTLGNILMDYAAKGMI